MIPERLACEVLGVQRQLTTATLQLSRALAFNQPQTWSMSMLVGRYPAFNQEAIAAIARDRLGYQGETKAMVLSLDEVIALDAEIQRRLQGQRRQPGIVPIRRPA